MKLRSFAFNIQACCVLGFSAGCFWTPADLGAGGGNAARCITPEEGEGLADQVLQLVNLERAERALQPVVVSPVLTKVAEDYACRMVEGKFFGHRDPTTGHGPAERALSGKYAFFAIGENLAAGQEAAADVMKVWMESPPHRALILDPAWKEIGIAVRADGEDTIYWVQEFGDPVEF